MYICLCNSVTDKDLKQMASQANISQKEICDSLKIGKDCGTCLREALNQLRAIKSSNSEGNLKK